MGKIKKIIDILIISIAITAFIILAGKIIPFKNLNASIDTAAGNNLQEPLNTDTDQSGNPGKFRLDLDIDEKLFKPVKDIFAAVVSLSNKNDEEPVMDTGPEDPGNSRNNKDQEPEQADVEIVSGDSGAVIEDEPENIQGSTANIEENIDYSRSEDFRIEVDLTRQRVTVLHKDRILREMICSGGAPESPTPLGEYVTSQKIEYAWVERFGVGAYYWIRFFEDYLIHSVPFDENGVMILEEYAKLGNPASHGCIRLKLEEAKWLYDTLPLGVKVVIY